MATSPTETWVLKSPTHRQKKVKLLSLNLATGTERITSTIWNKNHSVMKLQW